MDNNQLKTKLKVLEANVEARRDELGFAMSAAQVAREEIADLGKPVISESMASDLIEQLESVFADTIGNIDTCDLSPEYSINYSEICLESIDLDNVGVDVDELRVVFDQYFAIKEDKDEDIYNKP